MTHCAVEFILKLQQEDRGREDPEDKFVAVCSKSSKAGAPRLGHAQDGKSA